MKFKASDGTVQNIPCVMSFLSRNYLDVQTDKELLIPKDLFVCKVQQNSYTQQIIESMRFLIKGTPYKCVAKENILVDNIIEIKLQSDLAYEGDDLVNGIATQTIPQTTTTPTNLSISGNTTPKTSSSNNLYTIINNTTYTFNFSLIDALTNAALSTTIAQITSQISTSCTIKINTTSGGKSFFIKAVANEDSSITAQLLCTTNVGF